MATPAEIKAHEQVHRKLAWLPTYAGSSEIVAALRCLANKLQAEVNTLNRKVKKLEKDCGQTPKRTKGKARRT